jgi:hypothetical protein
MDNKVSIQVSPSDLQAIKDAIAVLQAKLGPLLIALTEEERRSLYKMGEASRPFVEKVLEYAVTNPEFLPPFTDLAEMQKDWKAISDLLPVFNVMSQLCSNLDDTLMEAGSEVMVPASAYYKSAQMGVKLGIPSSKPIVADLKVRFERRPKKSSPQE